MSFSKTIFLVLLFVTQLDANSILNSVKLEEKFKSSNYANSNNSDFAGTINYTIKKR